MFIGSINNLKIDIFDIFKIKTLQFNVLPFVWINTIKLNVNSKINGHFETLRH